jgi:subtilisin family serine protease
MRTPLAFESGTLDLPFEFESGEPVPEQIIGYLSVSSQGGVSVLESESLERAEPYHASQSDHQQAERAISDMGFTILAESRLGKSVAGPPQAYEELTGGSLVTKERLVRAEAGRQRYMTHVDIVGPGQPAALGVGVVRSEATRIEAVILEQPRVPMAVFPSPIPPTVQKYHLRLPDDVTLLLQAEAAHRKGQIGEGVTVAMIDSGQYAHPYFLAHGYDVRPGVSVVPGTNRAKDPVGHGTGESANIFAVAPGATLRPYRVSNDAGALVGAVAGFLRAKADQPQIMTNSWGGNGPFPPPGPPSPTERAFALEIRDAVEQGILVVFSGGNGQFSIEPQVPGVLAAGGAFVGTGLTLQASNYASGYVSPWFAGVTVPTVCGLVGLIPRAQYLMLPIPPGCQIDVMESAAEDGDTPDGTLSNDGWALFSGTSAAAPQLAGAAALVLGAKPGLEPAQVIEILTATAVDVVVGRCHPRFNQPAGPGNDVATGSGLVNASAAVESALSLP